MIFPINNHVQVKPISKLAENSIMVLNEKNYEECGIVVGSAKAEDGMPLVMPNTKVYFDSWQAARYDEGLETEMWLIPFSAIRAYEIPEE